MAVAFHESLPATKHTSGWLRLSIKFWEECEDLLICINRVYLNDTLTFSLNRVWYA